MRGGRFGSKAGRVAVVVALVFGTLAIGTTAASAAERSSTSTSATVGAATQASLAGLAHTNENEWG